MNLSLYVIREGINPKHYEDIEVEEIDDIIEKELEKRNVSHITIYKKKEDNKR